MYFLADNELLQQSSLDHGLVPYLYPPRYLRLVKSQSHALNYAAAGFHVSVTRGLAGGARDLSVSVSGTGPSSVKEPLNRPDLASLWSQAANLYLEAYRQAQSAPFQLESVKSQLLSANQAADQAYAQEEVEPPRDPVTQSPEPPMQASFGLFGFLKSPLVLGGALAYALFFNSKGKKRGPQRGQRRARRRR